MANADQPGPSAEEELARLADEASDREPPLPPAPTPTGSAFWSFVDRYGAFFGWAAFGFILVALLLAVTGGESFAWASFLSIPATALLVLYGLFLIRRRQQQQAAEFLLARQYQEQARHEVARMVLEQRTEDGGRRNEEE